MSISITNFIKIKKTAQTLQFKNAIALQRDINQDFIKQFALFIHPRADYLAEEDRCTVFTVKGTYIYSLFKTAIIRTETQSGNKIMYKR